MKLLPAVLLRELLLMVASLCLPDSRKAESHYNCMCICRVIM